MKGRNCLNNWPGWGAAERAGRDAAAATAAAAAAATAAAAAACYSLIILYI